MIGGSRPGRGLEIFSSPPHLDQLWGHSVSYPMVNGYQRLFPQGIKWPECEADNSPPSNADVNNAWSFTTVPPICLHGVGLY